MPEEENKGKRKRKRQKELTAEGTVDPAKRRRKRRGEEGDQQTLIGTDEKVNWEREREREREREKEGEEWDFVAHSLSPAVTSEPSASWIKPLASPFALTYVSLPLNLSLKTLLFLNKK